MAISFVIDPSIAPCFSFSSPRTIPLRNLHFHGRPISPLISKPNLRFPIFSAHQSNNSEEANSKQQADVNTLIRSYKQALFNGDETSVAQIETMFCKIEKEKNKMDQKVLSLSMKIASEKETKIRLQADFDNTRKKLGKDRLSTESNAKVQIMKSLLPIIDSFERAKLQVRVDTEKEKKIDTSYQGIYRQFVEVLRHLRLSAIATVGKPFDPLLHEAISREESEVVKAGIITEELKRGFVLGDRVLRPAKVKVSLGPVKKKTPSPAEEITPSS
ncbi:co-chaperone grpE family protein [Arabidopsis lyrata subsp. lyrata]|uniref:GrpE protein homolog n=1 Tax=Arabidopsis lyrata subsp. lyrata TaxID=81972 RepID=D7KM22_ARALL|nr:co-chaperone grpE family protein [Arabidopsis lyrata subsp. lyrata]